MDTKIFSKRPATTADLLSESDRVLQEVAQYLRDPSNFGFDLSIDAENKRIKTMAKISNQLSRNRAYG